VVKGTFKSLFTPNFPTNPTLLEITLEDAIKTATSLKSRKSHNPLTYYTYWLHALVALLMMLLLQDAGLNPVTAKTYRNILQAIFLTFNVLPWYRNTNKLLIKSSKEYFIDTNLLCHLEGRSLADLRINRPDLFGYIVGNFVASELVKLLSFGNIKAKSLHFRTSDNKDFILERTDGSSY
jgi:hypothetical protein